MALRPALLPPPLDEGEVVRLSELATKIVDCIDTGRSPASLIAEFNACAARSHDASDFAAAAGSMSMDNFARQVLTPRPPVLGDITRDEYLEIITRISHGACSESDLCYWLDLLEINLCPSIVDLIFHGDLSPEEVLERASMWKPIAL